MQVKHHSKAKFSTQDHIQSCEERNPTKDHEGGIMIVICRIVRFCIASQKSILEYKMGLKLV